MECKYNKGSFWDDKYCFRDFNCDNCPIKQEQELNNPIISNIKRIKPLTLTELLFRDNLSTITTIVCLTIILIYLIK